MTPTEKAREIVSGAIADGVMDWTDWRDDLADIIAAALADARLAALEEAAGVAEAHNPAWDDGPMTFGKAEIDAAETTARQIAARIRALATTDGE